MNGFPSPSDCVLSAIIFTLNEEINLPHCLESLKWCDDVIVVDTFSTDKTEKICRDAGARFFQHAFEGFGLQRNWALENTEPKHEWVLMLDADERVTPELAQELIKTVNPCPQNTHAWRLRRRFYMWGKWLRRSSLYPTWVVRLVRKGRVSYVNRGHGETQIVDGKIGALRHDLIDENHKGLEAWRERQKIYAEQEARYEIESEKKPFSFYELFSRDPLIRRHALKRLSWQLPLRPLLYFIYSYFFRLGFLDGLPGLRFCLMKAAFYKYLTQYKKELRRDVRSWN
ncbi:MAG: hypothetical protein A2Z83_05700 [Omnitrophica bacterium GWA2_52_8]|nr:MAG: hypothetical protein A2Z83_05700 [Omnitrophica bacterium GWA2_52_8]